MLTWLRIVVSCFCLVLCVLFAALWVRSSSYLDVIDQGPSYRRVALMSRMGIFSLTVLDPPMGPWTDARGRWLGAKANLWSTQSNSQSKSFGWRYKQGSTGQAALSVYLPHWLLVIIAGCIAYFAKPKPRWQFGLRELFVLSTIGAITVGTLAAVLRAISP